MSIPLAYNLRNLVVRKTTTIMTALGIALTVAVLLAILALVAGLRSTLSVSGDPLHVLVLRKGADSELVSVFLRSQFQDLKFKAGIATGRDGQPLASMEVVTIMILEGADRSEGSNFTVRGLPPAGIEMRRNVHIVRGRWFHEGQREVAVGKAIADRFPQAQIGKKVHFGRGDWEIVGVFDASGGAQASEVWGDLFQVSSDLQRVDAVSSGLVTATDPVTAKALVTSLNEDQRLGVKAMLEKEYYDQQTSSAKPIESVGLIVAIIMAIGSSFAAMNTMYAAVARRAREIGTLRVLGFSKGSILTSFLVEAAVLSGLGGLLGCLLALPLNGVNTAIGNNTYSETAFAFHVTPQIMLTGVIFAVVLGSLGGLFPARMASRKQILTALREG
ncbi:MAG TPA: ABC transporter permease [Verrucomicrobiae bacterium]|nr:ABC transporter permease [Verrucomicrobiae bacterium]